MPIASPPFQLRQSTRKGDWPSSSEIDQLDAPIATGHETWYLIVDLLPNPATNVAGPCVEADYVNGGGFTTRFRRFFLILCCGLSDALRIYLITGPEAGGARKRKCPPAAVMSKLGETPSDQLAAEAPDCRFR